MSTTELLPGYLDVTRLAIASFLARYREPTLTAYRQDLKAFVAWCQQYDLEVLRVTRGELEMYVRHLEGRGYAAATIARRFGTVATFLQVRRHRRGHPGEPGRCGHPAEGRLGGAEAHRPAPVEVRGVAVRRPHVGPR